MSSEVAYSKAPDVSGDASSELALASFLLVTRYNVRQKFMEERGADCEQVGYDRWLNVRRDLFDKWVIPGVVAQTDQDFIWMVVFDAGRITSQLRSDIARWDAEIPQFRPVFLCQHWAGSALVREILRTGVSGRVATARMDSDDIISPDYVCSLKESIALEPGQEGFCYPTGLKLRVEQLKDLRTADGDFIANPGFKIENWSLKTTALTRVTTTNNEMGTVYQDSHTKMFERIPVKDICQGRYRYVKIMHDDAVVNTPDWTLK